MARAANMAAIRRYIAEINQKNLAVLDEIFASEFVGHDPDGDIVGLAAMKKASADSRVSMPDLHVTIEEMIADEEQVVSRYTARATHMGELLGVAATGRALVITGIIIHRFAGGKVVEMWESPDNLGLAKQLGLALTAAN